MAGSLAINFCTAGLGNGIQEDAPPVIVQLSHAVFTFERLFTIGETGALNTSCCNRSSFSEITGNSRVSVQMSPHSPKRRAERPRQETHRHRTNAHSDNSTQMQLSTWFTGLSPTERFGETELSPGRAGEQPASPDTANFAEGPRAFRSVRLQV